VKWCVDVPPSLQLWQLQQLQPLDQELVVEALVVAQWINFCGAKWM
jgi:hypothetical protein